MFENRKSEHSEPILESKGMRFFRKSVKKKDKKMLKKGKIFENLGKNVKK